MIQRFNFYDIYGYLVPGLTFLAMMWLPFGLVYHYWPPAPLSSGLAAASALAAVILGYVVGHILQTLAIAAIPPTVLDTKSKQRRLPSDLLLDDDGPFFSAQFRKKLLDRIRDRSGIGVQGDTTKDADLRKRRDDAFPENQDRVGRE